MRAAWLLALSCVISCNYGTTKVAKDDPGVTQARGPVACEGEQLLTGTRLGTAKFRPGSVDTLQYSSDGSVLMSVGGSHAILWDSQTGRRRKEFEAWSGKASLSADGRRLARVEFGLLESGVRIESLDSGKTLRTWEDDSSDIDHLVLGPKGDLLAIANGPSVEVRTVGQDGPAHPLGTLEDEVRSLAFAPAGALRLAAGGAKGQLRMWDVATGSHLDLNTQDSATVMALSFSADGNTLAAVDSDGVVRLYSSGSETPVHVFSARVPGEPAELRKVAVTNDGARVIVGSWSGVYSLWNPDASGEGAVLVSVLTEGLIASGAAAFTPDGKTATAAAHAGAIRFWDAETGDERPQPEAGNLADVGEAIWLTEHRAVTAAGGRAANVWDLRCGKIESTLGGHARRVAHIAATRDSTLIATADEAGSVRVWDGASLKLRHEDTAQADGAAVLALSDDGRRLAVARRSGLVVQDAGTFEEVWREPQSFSDDTISAIAASPDGTLLLTGDTMGTVRWLDMSNGSSLASREDDYASTIRSIRFSPDGKRVATTASDKVRIYDAITGQPIMTFGAPGWSVSNAAWFSDNTRLAFGDSDGHLWVVHTTGGRVLRSAYDESLDISALALRSDDHALLTGHDDSSMRVWVTAELGTANESELEIERSPSVDAVPLLSGSAKSCPTVDGDPGKTLPPCAVAKLASSDFLLGDGAGEDSQLALSNDGALLATPAGEQLHVVEVSTGKVVSRMSCCEYGAASAVVFSPDASTIALTPPLGNTQTWTVERGRKSNEWRFRANSLAAAPDGETWAAVSTDGALHLVDIEGKIVRSLATEGFRENTTLTFSADSSLLLSADRWSVLVWDTKTGSPAKTEFDTYELLGDSDAIWWAGLDAKNNPIINASGKQHIGKAEGKWSSTPFPLQPQETDDVRGYSCADDGRVCVMATDRGLEVSHRGRGKSLLISGEVEHVSLLRTGSKLAVSDGQSAAVWDLATRRRLTPAPLPTTRGLAMDDEGTLVTLHDESTRVWKPGVHAPARSIKHPFQDLWFARSAGGAAALHEDGLVRLVLDSAKRTVLRPGSFSNLALSADRTRAALLSYGDETELQVVDAETGELAWQRTVPDATALALSSDGSKVAIGLDETIEVHSATSRVATMNVEHSVYKLAFSPNDATVVAVGGSHIDVYAANDGHEVASFADGLEVSTFAFVGDNDTIITGGDDHLVRLFDVTRKRQLGVLRGHEAPVFDVAANGGPTRVVTLDERGAMFEWNVTPLLAE
ncbi:MAG: WD40 repeat domain-containing protein [Nannocystales bacterium]